MQGTHGPETPPQNYEEARTNSATPEFIRDLTRIHGVTAVFIRGPQEFGYTVVSADDLVYMRIQGVSLDYVKTMRTRLKDPSVDELVEKRIHEKA